MAAERLLMPAVLTIAGSDSCGGAGLEADLKTFGRCGVYGLCAVTAVTAQDGVRVYGVFPVRPAAVVAQAEAALRAGRPEAVKTGMLWSAGIVEAVARFLAARRLRRFVLDPVLATHGGDPLALPGAGRAMVRRLFPLAALVTPNLREAEEISGVKIRGAVGLEEAARRILGKGPRAVLIKGGHGEGRRPTGFSTGRGNGRSAPSACAGRACTGRGASSRRRSRRGWRAGWRWMPPCGRPRRTWGGSSKARWAAGRGRFSPLTSDRSGAACPRVFPGSR